MATSHQDSLNTLIELLPIGAYRLGMDGAVLQANAALLRLNGFTSAAEMRADPGEFIPNPCVDPSRRALFYQLLQQDGRVQNFESEAIRYCTGERMWIRENAQKVLNESGTPLYFEGTVEDITHERATLAALRTSEAMLHNILQTIPDRVWMKDLKGVYLTCNQAFAQGLKTTPEQLIGTTDDHWVDPATASDIRASDDLAYHAGRHIRLEEYMAGADGVTPTLYEIVKTPFLDPYGDCTGVVCIARDVQERKVAEAVLRDTSEQLELAIMGADLGRWDHDLTVEKGYCMDARACLMLGRDIDESTKRRPWGHLIHPDDLPAAQHAMQQHIQNHTPAWQAEYRVRHANGQWVWLSSRGKVVQTAQNGAPQRMVGTLMDVSVRKQAEHGIEHLAFHDSLTGLPNRRLLGNRIQNALLSSVRTHQYAALLFMDLDQFKQLNDTFGHDAGDVLLQEVSSRLLQCIRAIDTVARLGGDEFVVLVQDLGPDAAAAHLHASTVAHKILNSLNEPYRVKDHQHTVTPSIGVTLFLGKDNEPDDLLKQADIAMYHAKKMGRNTICFYPPR